MPARPDFLGVGTERAGTSWVFSMITAYPGAWVPPLKELHYFDRIDPGVPAREHRYRFHLPGRLKHKFVPFMKMPDRPELYKNNWRENLKWDWRYFTGPFTDDWYCSLFDPVFTKGRTCGEYTPAYCNLGRETIRRILKINPDMKFLMMLRHPLDQMRSSLIQHFVMIEGRDFRTVREREMLDWLHSPFARKKCNLSEILSTWRAEVPAERFFIGHHEEISQAPDKLIEKIYAFLGLDPGFRPPESLYKKKINAMENRTLPAAVENEILRLFSPEVERMKRGYPDIARRWSLECS